MKKTIITVVGKDSVGIIAKVCTYLAENDINILDISQTIVDGYFNNAIKFQEMFNEKYKFLEDREGTAMENAVYLWDDVYKNYGNALRIFMTNENEKLNLGTLSVYDYLKDSKPIRDCLPVRKDTRLEECEVVGIPSGVEKFLMRLDERFVAQFIRPDVVGKPQDADVLRKKKDFFIALNAIRDNIEHLSPEDLEKIDEKNLYEYYQQLINECKIDIFVSGIIDEKIIKNNENIVKLKDREPQYNEPKIIAKRTEKENDVQESMDVTQGKLIIGMDLDIDDDNLRFDVMIYNSIFGGSANSKLFQNVREKASLAYTASSSYYRFKNNIFINCGIEIKNYEKALEIIKQQIEDMKKGDFTDEEVENAKKGIIASIKTIDDEQDTEITYFFSQELSKSKCNIEQYMQKISEVTTDKVVDVANKVSINTVYFLKD